MTTSGSDAISFTSGFASPTIESTPEASAPQTLSAFEELPIEVMNNVFEIFANVILDDQTEEVQKNKRSIVAVNKLISPIAKDVEKRWEISIIIRVLKKHNPDIFHSIDEQQSPFELKWQLISILKNISDLEFRKMPIHSKKKDLALSLEDLATIKFICEICTRIRKIRESYERLEVKTLQSENYFFIWELSEESRQKFIKEAKESCPILRDSDFVLSAMIYALYASSYESLGCNKLSKIVDFINELINSNEFEVIFDKARVLILNYVNMLIKRGYIDNAFNIFDKIALTKEEIILFLEDITQWDINDPTMRIMWDTNSPYTMSLYTKYELGCKLREKLTKFERAKIYYESASLWDEVEIEIFDLDKIGKIEEACLFASDTSTEHLIVDLVTYHVSKGDPERANYYQSMIKNEKFKEQAANIIRKHTA